jgi:hypothetical protein
MASVMLVSSQGHNGLKRVYEVAKLNVQRI